MSNETSTDAEELLDEETEPLSELRLEALDSLDFVTDADWLLREERELIDCFDDREAEL